ncbi:MAG: histone family protein DNA-binding protein [Microgenomates group bacterium GW2011_GWF2_47_9]|nr:MAG: histone family protein DNA-binding protein [Microgenomates group bacterium GW2011_GWF2_47_9]
MKKSNFYEITAKSAHLTKKAAKDAIDTFLSEMTKTLKKGDKVVLSGFGTFSIGKVGPKDVVPFGKEDKRVTVKSHNVISFKAAKPLRKAIW